jgi:hypothetical protein
MAPTRRHRGRRRNSRSEEIQRLDPVGDSAEIMRLINNQLLPRWGEPMVLNLLYCVGFMRICGQIEGARAVDRNGKGKIHLDGDKRAADTISYFTRWVQHGATSDAASGSIARVKRMHDHYARDYSMSNETFVHTIAFFTVQFEHLFGLVKAKGFTQAEQTAQVTHWRMVGEQLGVEALPETWDEMEDFVDWYETSPAWFGPTPEGRRSADALIDQFANRWLPPGLRWVARPLLLSLHDDRVLRALGQTSPSAPIVWTVRRLVRLGLILTRQVLSSPRPPETAG